MPFERHCTHIEYIFQPAGPWMRTGENMYSIRMPNFTSAHFGMNEYFTSVNSCWNEHQPEELMKNFRKLHKIVLVISKSYWDSQCSGRFRRIYLSWSFWILQWRHQQLVAQLQWNFTKAPWRSKIRGWPSSHWNVQLLKVTHSQFMDLLTIVNTEGSRL